MEIAKKIWGFIEKPLQGFRTLTGTALMVWVAPAYEGVTIPLGPLWKIPAVGLPVDAGINILGLYLIGKGIHGKYQTYKEAVSSGKTKKEAMTEAVTHGPAFDFLKAKMQRINIK